MDEFRTLMTLMMLSSLSGGGSAGAGMGAGLGSSASAGGMGMDMGALMAPLMLGLLEKLMAQQVQAPQAAPVQDAVLENELRIDPGAPHGMPLTGGRLTQASHAGHVALDFGVPVGTDVRATMDGKVVHAGWNDEGYGKLVILQNGPYRVYFAHLSKIPVKVGQIVKAGEVIGLSGNTGNSTGPHLHYEVRKNGVPINPAPFTLKK
jgi:murein DD-endopeptidase MepM/ murein hydrolase activator NlpD